MIGNQLRSLSGQRAPIEICPYCETVEYLHLVGRFLSKLKWVFCDKCDTSGPKCDSAFQAMAKWDRFSQTVQMER